MQLTQHEEAVVCSHSIVRMLKLWEGAILDAGTDVALDDFESSKKIIEKLWEAKRDELILESWSVHGDQGKNS